MPTTSVLDHNVGDVVPIQERMGRSGNDEFGRGQIRKRLIGLFCRLFSLPTGKHQTAIFDAGDQVFGRFFGRGGRGHHEHDRPPVSESLTHLAFVRAPPLLLYRVQQRDPSRLANGLALWSNRIFHLSVSYLRWQ